MEKERKTFEVSEPVGEVEKERELDRENQKILVHYDLGEFQQTDLVRQNLGRLNELCSKHAGIERGWGIFYTLSPKEGGEQISERHIEEEVSFVDLVSRGRLYVADAILANNYANDPTEENFKDYLANIQEVKSIEELDSIIPKYQHRREQYNEHDDEDLVGVTNYNYAELILIPEIPLSIEVIKAMLEQKVQKLKETEIEIPPNWSEETLEYLVSNMKRSLLAGKKVTPTDIEKEIETEAHKLS